MGAPQWRSCIDLDSGPFAIKLAAALIGAMPTAAQQGGFFLKSVLLTSSGRYRTKDSESLVVHPL